MALFKRNMYRSGGGFLGWLRPMISWMGGALSSIKSWVPRGGSSGGSRSGSNPVMGVLRPLSKLVDGAKANPVKTSAIAVGAVGAVYALRQLSLPKNKGGWDLGLMRTHGVPGSTPSSKVDVLADFQSNIQNFSNSALKWPWNNDLRSSDSFELLQKAMAAGGDAKAGSAQQAVREALMRIAQEYNGKRPGLNLKVEDMLTAYRQGRDASAPDVPSRINGALDGLQEYFKQQQVQDIATVPHTDNPFTAFFKYAGQKIQEVASTVLVNPAQAATPPIGAKPLTHAAHIASAQPDATPHLAQASHGGTNWLSGLSVLAAGSAIAELVSGAAQSNAEKAHAIARLAATIPQNLQHFATAAQAVAQVMPSVAKEGLQVVASNIHHAVPAVQHALPLLTPLLTLAAVATDIYKSSRPEFLEKSKQAYAAAQERVAKAEAVENETFKELAGRFLRGGQKNAAALTLKKAEILNSGRNNFKGSLKTIQQNMEVLKTQAVQSAQGSVVVLQKNTEQLAGKVSHGINELRNAVVHQSQGTLISIKEAGSKTLGALQDFFSKGNATKNAEQAFLGAQLAYATSNVR
ncbi:MAG: hypothetical protein ACK48E_02870 [Holosporales bacterium]|jgi:hypothetical protein